MVKLTNQHLVHLKNVIELAYIFKIKSVIIGNDSIREIGEDRSPIIIDGELELPFNVDAVHEVSTFKHKLDIAMRMKDRVMGALVDETDGYVKNLLFSGIYNGGRTTLEIICANPGTVQAPESIKEKWTNKNVKVPKGVYETLKRAQIMAHSESITIKSDQGGVSIQLQDVVGNVFNHKLQREPSGSKFSNRYYFKTFLRLLSVNPEPTLEISNKGVIRTNLRGLDVYIFPMV